MFACTTVIFKYMKSLGNDVHNLSGDLHVRSTIYHEFFITVLFV